MTSYDVLGECGGVYIRGRDGESDGIAVWDNTAVKGRRKVRMSWPVRRLVAKACWSNALFSGS